MKIYKRTLVLLLRFLFVYNVAHGFPLQIDSDRKVLNSSLSHEDAIMDLPLNESEKETHVLPNSDTRSPELISNSDFQNDEQNVLVCFFQKKRKSFCYGNDPNEFRSFVFRLYAALQADEISGAEAYNKEGGSSTEVDDLQEKHTMQNGEDSIEKELLAQQKDSYQSAEEESSSEDLSTLISRAEEMIKLYSNLQAEEGNNDQAEFNQKTTTFSETDDEHEVYENGGFGFPSIAKNGTADESEDNKSAIGEEISKFANLENAAGHTLPENIPSEDKVIELNDEIETKLRKEVDAFLLKILNIRMTRNILKKSIQ